MFLVKTILEFALGFFSTLSVFCAVFHILSLIAFLIDEALETGVKECGFLDILKDLKDDFLAAMFLCIVCVLAFLSCYGVLLYSLGAP